MNPQWTGPIGALALCLFLPLSATQHAPAAEAAVSPVAQPLPGVRRDRGADALERLRSAALGKLRVQRNADGEVARISSTDGRAMLAARDGGGPGAAAMEQLSRYGAAFGVDGTDSRAVATLTSPSATGGTVVRAEQVVDGVPVFGGQVVMSLDEARGLVSVNAATTAATDVRAAVVSETTARRVARSVAAKAHRVEAATLTVSDHGRRLYDPALVHVSDPLGVRPVWEFEVTDGSEVRETVLIGTGRGEVALHFNDAPGVDRVVCDNAGARTISSSSAVPACTTPARSEGGAVSGTSDVDEAFDNLGATSRTYAELGEIDLTTLIGAGSPAKLMSTVRWCFTDSPCPFANAFWDGTQMVFGAGYAGADDVVAHELTHGYVERTSALFPFHQSGALNESLADVLGEVVDHRSNAGAGEDNSAWDLGEDLPGGALRNLADPTRHGQPDRMRSSLYVTADAFADGGAVHDNDGVGNKTAFLISQGGPFNGVTVNGIDKADAGLAKTGRLYLEVIPRLTSGSEYADLGRVLAGTCDELAASSTAGFTTGDCVSVRKAVEATELALPALDPEAAAPEAAVSCPARFHRPRTEQRDTDTDNVLFTSFGSLWQRTPANGSPRYAHEGTSSLFGWNPDPGAFGDPPQSTLTSRPVYVDPGLPTYLLFHHAHLFEFYDPVGGSPASYPDGGLVTVQSRPLGGTDADWTTATALPWVNGPDKQIGSAGGLGFGGDSHGYGSSRVDLSSLGGREARFRFTVSGDASASGIGWWVDDVQTYTCSSRVPAGATVTSARTRTTSTTIAWNPPAQVGSGISTYRVVTGSGKVLTTLPGSARSGTVTGLDPAKRVDLSVRSVNAFGEMGGPNNAISIHPTRSWATTSTTRARRKRSFTVTGRVVRASDGRAVAGMPMTLERRPAKSRYWFTVATRSTGSRGTVTWSVRQRTGTYYRVTGRGVGTSFGSTSAPRLVR